MYSDTDKLKKSLEKKRELLITEREKILGTRDASKANLEKLQNEVWEDLICLFCSVNLHKFREVRRKIVEEFSIEDRP